MKNFDQIQAKLQQFIKKYYTNELIKGVLLFFAIGFVYFFITLLIEHFLWLKPTARTLLFLLFILVEIALLIFYIIIPVFKIYGFKQGLNEFQASEIIGKHFPEVSDKLLNMIQLKHIQLNSELIEASIEQKSDELKLIPFKRAIDFSKNKKYIKYALIPIVIWALVLITGNITIFNNSFSRVVDYKTQYEPPAPFSFKVLNSSLNVIEGQSLTLSIVTDGSVAPEEAKIYFSNENYYLENTGLGNFKYTFSNIHTAIDFYVEANGVQSKNYQIHVLATPIITNVTMVLNYPGYTGKSNEVVKNTGNAIVPQGTNITWQVETHQTDEVSFSSNEVRTNFDKTTKDFFNYSKKVIGSTNYQISSSNNQLKNHETLNFSIEVVSDEYPKILVQSDIDSITRGPAQFVGQLSDDYAVKKLELVYYDKNNPNANSVLNIDIERSSLTEFYYVFPDGIAIDKGIEYEFYFQVYDNDVVNGSKKAKSKSFSYYNKTDEELKEELLKEQKATLSSISKALEKSKKENAELNEFKDELQKKAKVNWNDTKKLDDFVKRQNRYQEMFQKQTNKLEQNLKEQPVSDELKDKKQELEKRIEETKKLAKQDKLLEELNKLSEKLEKEDLVDKLKEIAKKNQQNEQSLERILELTKRFYVEQKANQIAEKLNQLSKEQSKLANESEENNSSEKQDEINKEFANIKKDVNDLENENKQLKRPMKLSNDPEKLDEINEDLQNALDELKKDNSSSAKKNQKSAAKKMKQMGKSMEQSMMSMEGEMIDENIEDLRKIVENLIEFSFQQEDLMTKFSDSDNNNPEFPKNLKEQYILKEYFEHIDDSLYMLSLRLVKMGSGIQKEVSDIHFNLDESLANFSENIFEQGISNQHFVITSSNNLANQLSDLLESLMNASANMGKGKGKGNQPDFALPDIIKKQGELTDQLKEGQEKGKKPGEKEGDKKGGKPGENEGKGNDGLGEKLNGELFEIYKEQAKLREMLQDLLGGEKGNGKEGSGDVIKQMEELENEMLEKGFSDEVIEKMQELNYELLKLEKAQKEQGKDEKRNSEMNSKVYESTNIDSLILKNLYFNYNEILNRQSLPLRTIYKKKVQEYFKTEE